MRRFLITMIAATALATAGCGEDEAADDAQDAREGIEQSAEQGPAQTDISELAAETQRLAEQIAQAGQELAANPDADTDQRLQDAEERANELAEQAQGEESEASGALRDANERLAEAAAELREAESAEDVGRVLDEQLSRAAEALGTTDGQRMQEELERLRDELPEFDGG
jgi:hypothetical protein